MANTFTLEVITAERLVLQKEINSLIVPGVQGYLGVYPKHAPFITELAPGVVTYTLDGEKKKLAVSGGYLEVFRDKATILADAAELPEEIDIDRAKRAKERAERRLRQHEPGINVVRAELAIRRALARLKTAEK